MVVHIHRIIPAIRIRVMPENALAGGEEVDSSLPQESNLNSGSIAVEVSIFYNSCSGFVNEFHNVILNIAT